MKKAVVILIIILCLIIGFYLGLMLLTAKLAAEPPTTDFKGPTGTPSIKGPAGPPPQ